MKWAAEPVDTGYLSYARRKSPLTPPISVSILGSMKTLLRLIGVFGMLALSMPAGINWRAVWLEPNPILLHPGSSRTYVVKGIHGGSEDHVDLTHSQYLSVTSSDESVVAVDTGSARLIGKSVGQVEIRVSFSECTSITRAFVKVPTR
jgi:hypothetical protein